MKIKKIIIMLLFTFILISILSMLTDQVYAADNPLDKILQDGKEFTEGPINNLTTPITIKVEKLQTTSKIISSILFIVAIGVALATTAVLGINLMIQSAEEKAKIKEALVPLVIGMFISFGAYGLWKAMVVIFAELYGIKL